MAPVHAQNAAPSGVTPRSGLAVPAVSGSPSGAHRIEALGAGQPALQPASNAVLTPDAPAGIAEMPVEERPPRPVVTYPLSDGSAAPITEVIGSGKVHVAATRDTFLDLARDYDLGYNEIVAANPGVDPWIARPGTELLIPTEWILPRAPREGVVVNIPEMRMYYYLPAKDGEPQSVVTYPVGLGRQEWQTPQAEFRVRGKTKNPTWVIPESIKAERIEKKGSTEEFIPGGHPDNPLGKHRVELTLPMYAIHGTNVAWGVGMQVSHGCVRLYPEDIEAFFPLVEIGVPGRFLYQPIKVGVRDGRVMVEVHDDIYGVAPWPWVLAQELIKEMGLERHVDREKLEAAVEAANGVPTDVSPVKWPDFDVGGRIAFDAEGRPVNPYPVAAGAY
jgi:L,D-transpeptidase ErfK/SrfK